MIWGLPVLVAETRSGRVLFVRGHIPPVGLDASTRRSAWKGALAAVVAVVAVVVGTSCGPSYPEIIGVDVTLVKNADCTQTGQGPPSCVPAEDLARNVTKGRWLIEIEPDQSSATVTTQDGRTLVGLTFPNDGAVIVTDGCAGEGGDCVFVRRRFDSTDANNNNCRTFGELVAVGHFPPDDPEQFVGVLSDINGVTEACGTPSTNQDAFAVTGTRVAQPVRSLEEANP